MLLLWSWHSASSTYCPVFDQVINVVIDCFLGLIPFVGDLLDVAFKVSHIWRRNNSVLYSLLNGFPSRFRPICATCARSKTIYQRLEANVKQGLLLSNSLFQTSFFHLLGHSMPFLSLQLPLTVKAEARSRIFVMGRREGMLPAPRLLCQMQPAFRPSRSLFPHL